VLPSKGNKHVDRVPRKQSPSPEQIRQQVDQVMDRWQSYPSFGALLDDLMRANGLGYRELAQVLNTHGRRSPAESTISQYRSADLEPSYAFIEDLLATNALHLDPNRIQAADGERPAGDQRIALFAAAGLIEVTPDSIREWNREVLARYSRLTEAPLAGGSPAWSELMAKLLSFHLQGGRKSLSQIAREEVRDDSGDHLFIDPARLRQLLDSNRVIPSDRERLALAHYAGLDHEQIRDIEARIAAGTMPLVRRRHHRDLSDALNSILEKLAAQEISTIQLAALCNQQVVPGGAPISQPDLSIWRHGKHLPTLEKLRVLAAGLERFGPSRLTNPVTANEIERLVIAAGYSTRDLTDSTHEIIARIDNESHIKKLLKALRTAVDVALGHDATARVHMWETPGVTYPTAEQVRELLRHYNDAIRQNGFMPLGDEEIEKVAQVAEREYASWHQRSHAEKLTERKPRDRRRPPSPSLAGTAPQR